MTDIPIYGPLRSMTEGGKAAYASQIYDESLGKFQSEINQQGGGGGGGGTPQGDSVFVVEYGVTTLAEIQSALTNGKVPVLYYDGYMYLYSTYASASGDGYFFNVDQMPNIRTARIDSSGWKSITTKRAETTANRVTSISSSSTNTQYPSAKCVYDLVGNIETLLASI